MSRIDLDPFEQSVVDRTRKLLADADENFGQLDYPHMFGQLEVLAQGLLRIIDGAES